MRNIHLICNAHLDPVWLWQWEEGAAETVSTFRTAAELCENNGSFVFNHNEVILYEWVAEYEPELFQRIKKLVQKGQWHIMGGWYLQPDCNMPSGESFVRQILIGRQYFKKHFGIAPKTAINFDPFGHSRGLVQIMAKSGFTSYLFGRPDQNWMPLQNKPFKWVGFDGSQITARRFVGWYNTQLGNSRAQIEQRITDSDNPTEAVLWGVGNHGGGPSRVDLKNVNDLIANRDDVKIMHSTPDAYFADVAERSSDLPRREEDLNPWAIGCYTSMIRVKQKHRQLENELYKTEKMLSAATANNLLAWPKDDLLSATKDLLFAQFHDILPGSAIQPVEEASLRTMDHGLEILSRIKTRAFFALACGQKKAAEGQIPILVYNPHPWKTEEIVECEFNLHDFNRDGYVDIEVCKNGRALPTQIEKEDSNFPADWRKKVVFRTTLQPGQMNRFDCKLKKIKAKPPIKLTAQNGAILFENDRISVKINTRTGLIDKYTVDGVDHIQKAAFCPVVLDDNEDSWGMLYSRFGKNIGKFKLLNRQEGTKFSGVKNLIDSVRIIEDGSVRTVVEAVFGFEESFICQQYKLPKVGTEIEVQTRVLWNQKEKMLKMQIPLAYPKSRYLGQTAFGTQKLPQKGNEAVAQKWVAALDESQNRALTCINDGIYGSDLSGRNLRLSLLRSPAYSGHPYDDREILSQDRFSPRIDQGERIFKFWINAGQQNKRMDMISSEALVKNEKPFALSFFPKGDGKLPKPLASVNKRTIEITTVKKAESNNDWIVRLFNTIEKKQTAQFKMPALDVQSKLSFGPFEVKTLRIGTDKKITEVDLMEDNI